jgi:uronate dehydrogenase
VPTHHHVLVTGSAGAIGQPVCRELMSRGHAVRGFDARETSGVADAIVADLTDRAALDRAVRGVDTLVHLAAHPQPTDDFLGTLLAPNIVGVYHVFEAARAAGVKRVVYASSVQVGTRFQGTHRPVGPDDGTAPSNYYGVTKVFGEAVAQMHALAHGTEVLAIRIGFLPRTPWHVTRLQESEGGKAIYLSPRDAGRFFACCVEAELPAEPKFHALYATSIPQGRVRLDIESARRLIGYEPRETWPQGMDGAEAR